jgi:SAM-dependent methyltransferase
MAAIRLNKLCDLPDWRHPERFHAMRLMEPDHAAAFAGYPAGREHRKSWEYAQLLLGFQQLGALRPEGLVLSVAAGSERPVFLLTNYVRWVFATDIYGTGVFSGREAAPSMLTSPDQFAQNPYNRNHLVVQFMNALDLCHDSGTFDIVFSLSSIEHFGGTEAAATALREMHRVAKPGGIVMLTTECIVNGAAPLSIPDLQLFTPAMIQELAASAPGLQLVEDIDFTIGAETLRCVMSLPQAVADAAKGFSRYPHVLLEMEGRYFTSLSLFWRKV